MSLLQNMMEEFEENSNSPNELSVSFGYQCMTLQNVCVEDKCMFELSDGMQSEDSTIRIRSSSFSCLSGAALSANFTLANTNICNGLLGVEILPSLDSPKSFRRLASSPSLSRPDLLSCSSQNSISTLGGSTSTDSDMIEGGRVLLKPMSAPTKVESSSFLNVMDVQMAGGAAGEDRVQAVCSEENGWLFCGVYDGFNGRDAADFLAGTLYDSIMFHLHLLEWKTRQREALSSGLYQKNSLEGSQNHGAIKSELSLALSTLDIETKPPSFANFVDAEFSSEAFRLGVLDCLIRALSQAESDFMHMVEQEMQERPDLVSIGSCVLTVLLHGRDLYVLNLGDSRAVLGTISIQKNGSLEAIQLSETHSVDNEVEYKKMLADHPDDPSVIIGGKVKGKLKLTRAFGVGYLKKSQMNDALIGILRVRNLQSPPYVRTQPFTINHRVSENDLFVILGSDGLFDFFNNDEVVEVVHKFIHDNPLGDPAKYLIEQVLQRAAENAGFSTEELMRIPVGRRRKYHDDVTVIVILLGNKQRTSKASIAL